MTYEKESYEEDEFFDSQRESERAPEPERTDEFEPANDNLEIANDNNRDDTDSVDAKLGGEKGDWNEADHGESGYSFLNGDVTGPDGRSWLEAWGDSPENVALYEEMIAHFSAGETNFQLPDHEEHTDEGVTLYKTFMLLNEDGSVGYEIHPHHIPRIEDDELLTFDYERDDGDEPARLMELDEFPEPVADVEPDIEPDIEAAAAEMVEMTPQAEGSIVHETIETAYASAETIATAEIPELTTEHEAPAVAQRATAGEADAWLVKLLEPVMYKPAREDRTEAAHVEPMTAEPTAHERVTDTEPAILQTEQDVVTAEMRSVIPDLPVYERVHADMPAPAAELREETAHELEKHAVRATETIAPVAAAPAVAVEMREPAAQTSASPETAPRVVQEVAAKRPQERIAPMRETIAPPARAQEVATPSGAKEIPRERVVPLVPVRAPSTRRETTTVREPLPRRIAREPQRSNTERSRGSSSMTERYRRESAPRTARTETRAIAPVPAEIIQRALRGKPEPVHPTQQAARARWYVQAYGENDNAPQSAPNSISSLNGITLKRAA